MKNSIFEINAQGELINPALLDDIRETYKPDSPFLTGIVPYLIMVLCGFVDASFFYNLFKLVSYENKLLLIVEIMGLLVGFDVLPLFVGMHFKKLRQGLSRDKLTLGLALFICILVCALNIGLRIVTVDRMSPKSDDQTYFDLGEEVQADAEEYPNAEAWMMAVMGMVVPIATSVVSFYVSNHCYDPLMIKKKREEVQIRRSADKIRRLRAMAEAYETEQDIRQRMEDEDTQQYHTTRSTVIALLLEYHDYIRRHLMAQMQTPTSTSALSVLSDGTMMLGELQQLYHQTSGSESFPILASGSEEKKKEEMA